MSLRLFLIRHGETAWSKSGQHTGQTDIPLTERGEWEARELQKRLSDITFDAVFTSPLQRAKRTCELARFDRPETTADLSEWNYGQYEGLRTSEIISSKPHWNLFREGCPGGESPVDISARANRFLAVARTLHGNIAAFSHGHFIRALAVEWIGLPMSGGANFALDTASLSLLSYDHHDPPSPVIAFWNLGQSAEFGTAP